MKLLRHKIVDIQNFMILYKSILYKMILYKSLIYIAQGKISMVEASIFGKPKPTAAILKGPPQEYSGVTETKIKTEIFY